MDTLPRLLAAGLVLFLICVFASMPAAAADSTDNTLLVGFFGDIGGRQYLYLNDVYITGCDGKTYPKHFSFDDVCWHGESNHVETIYLPFLKNLEPFKEVRLDLTLKRDQAYPHFQLSDYFSIDVTDLVTKTKNEPYTIRLRVSHSYGGNADAVTIRDRNGNELKHFPAVAEPPDKMLLVGFSGDIGSRQYLYLNDVHITGGKTTCFEHFDDVYWHGESNHVERIYIPFLKNLEPFKEVKLDLTLKRDQSYPHRQLSDCFSIDVTDLVTKAKNKPYTIQLRVSHSYGGNVDAVTICDCNGNELKHFPAVAEQPDKMLLVGFSGDIGSRQYLYLNDVHLTDGKTTCFEHFDDVYWHVDSDHVERIYIPVLKDLGPFEEVKLNFTLKRAQAESPPLSDCFSIDVTDLVTKAKNKPYTIQLRVSHSYGGCADAVTICDCNGNELKHFPATGEESFCIVLDGEMDGDIGYFQDVQLNGITIIDSRGHHSYTCDDTWFYRELKYTTIGRILTKDISEPFILNYNELEKVELKFTLERIWGIFECYQRLDCFSIDVTDLVTKEEDGPYTVKLKAGHTYMAGKADAVTFYDWDKKKLLKHFPATSKSGYYTSQD